MNIRKQAGDTLVEVLLATVILSAVLAAAYTLSNRASQINQQSFERTQVTKYMQQQAELVRAARDTFDPTEINPQTDPLSKPWDDIKGFRQAIVPDLGATCATDISTGINARATPFYVNSDMTVDTYDPATHVLDQIFYVWTEMQTGVDSEYWDVHVYGCWEGLGGDVNQVSSIIIRLGDPR